ncbi:MAG: protein arginine kinase [Phycisphaerae bacterium]
MILGDLTKHAGEWLRGEGPSHDVVVSSRVRLARNQAGMPFLSRCTDGQKQELEAHLRQHILASGIAGNILYVDIAAAGELDRQLLLERHLISREHAQSHHPCGVVISESETLAIMVNEEDHLRIQVLRSGLRLEESMAEIFQIDDKLEERIDFAYHSRYGYLTACPTNVGTGLRISAMLHLPALKMTGDIDKAIRAARDMQLEIRGLYGEGTEAAGDLFQISNQTTLGKSEEQLVRDFSQRTIPKFIDYERRARQVLLKKQPAAFEDKIYRAIAILRSARVMSSQETMYLLSLLRLGIMVGKVTDIDLKTVNEVFLLTQPAHLQKILKREMNPQERGEARAAFIRTRLGAG